MLITKATVFLKGLVDDLFELMWYIRVDPNRRHWWTLQNSPEDERRRVATKRQHTRTHLVKHRTKRKQVGASIKFLSSNLLRGHISHGAQRRTGAGKVLL